MTILRCALASIAVLAIAGACTGPPLAQPRPGTTGSAPPPAAGTRVIDRSKVLRGFMLHEREGAEVVHKYDVADECFGRSQTTASSQTGGGGNGDPVLHHQLNLYADEAAAALVFAGLRHRLAPCLGWEDARVLTPLSARRWGDEAVAMTVAKPADGAGEYTNAPVRLVAVRVGRAVATFHGYPQVNSVDGDAERVVQRLCWFNATCKPPAFRPAPLAILLDGGEAWVAVLDRYVANDTNAIPGWSIAEAADIGYDATIVPIDCDEGAGAPLSMRGPEARYVVVYFATRPDAEAFATALPVVRARVLPVTTRCIG